MTEDKIRDIVHQVILKEMDVYHGSMSNFNQFDDKFMGSGEGAQIYGWGTYLTQDEDVAEYYIRNAYMQGVNRQSNHNMKGLGIFNQQNDPRFKPDAFKMIHGYLYAVDIPNDNGNNYINWNTNDIQTLNVIIQRLSKVLNQEQINFLMNKLVNANNKWYQNFNKISNFKGLYNVLTKMLGSQKNASVALNNSGFIGIKVPLDNKRGGIEGKWNYVIFNSNNIKVVNKSKISYNMPQFDLQVHQGYAQNNKAISNISNVN